jgi:sugar/nucleoside kinase (ribokinase family)
MMNGKRTAVCQSTVSRLSTAKVESIQAVIGMDGFVDEIIQVVDKRHSPEQFDRLKNISDFAQRVDAASGCSSNLELIVTDQKLGGNGPIMSHALAKLGLSVTYIGNLGYPDLHPVFKEMADLSKVLSIAPPCHTDALEFMDGKLMLGKLSPAAEINWKNIELRVGVENLTKMIYSSQLIGTVNWTMLPFMNEIWNHLLTDVLPRISKRPRLLFVDLADPEKRTLGDLRAALKILGRFEPHLEVVLGLNLKEAEQVSVALDLQVEDHLESRIESVAVKIRKMLAISTVVIHPRAGAAAANAEGSASFDGPFVSHPKISTGAGDHFNAGFVLGCLLKLRLEEALCVGTATSGYYVRTAQSPTLVQLTEFIRELPSPQI